ncbi:MAG: hypothetical protein LJE83_14790 [Gammaproteobacteria bacterium]|nr:hypothetical protein [Gammaproteobacteria bacterium]
MSRISCKFIVLSSVLLTVACSTSNNEKNDINIEPGALDIILCEEPRPQICTREYNPVCAKLQDGSVKTYATACTSCADSKVKGYTTGACSVVLLDKSDQAVQ